jgi:hypothetical protein
MYCARRPKPSGLTRGALAAGKLQSAGLIHYTRGRITVIDRPRLEVRACERYQVVKTQFDRLLPYAIASRSGSGDSRIPTYS